MDARPDPPPRPDAAPGPPAPALGGILDDLAAAAGTRDRLALGEVADALGARGFGPLLALLALALILPTGMIPGLPNLVAVLIGLIAVEMALGRRGLRLPGRLRRIAVKGDHLRAFVARARPATRPLGRVLRPRHAAITAPGPWRLVIAAVLLLTAVVKFAVGLVPGLPFLLSLPVLLIGLGLAARDGLAVAAGLVLFLMPTGAILSWGWGRLAGAP